MFRARRRRWARTAGRGAAREPPWALQVGAVGGQVRPSGAAAAPLRPRFLVQRHWARPAITAPTTQRAWRALQVHHKDGPVRDASSKGGVEGAYLGPRLPAARAPAWARLTHARQGAARSAPESPGVASA